MKSSILGKLAKIRSVFVLLTLSSGRLLAQSASEVVIHSGTEVYAHPGSFTNVFLDVTNSGQFTSAGTALINFYARTWRNEAGSIYMDESADGLSGTGGIFRFSGQFLNPQRIVSIDPQPYNGFPNLRIDNLQNVTLETGNVHVNHVLDFVNGRIILNNVDLNVGFGGVGSITGYGRTNYIVTGSGMTGGSLIRGFAGTGTAAVEFPVGTSLTSYTPVAITYKGALQNLKVRVADNVYQKFNFPEYVNKTWIVQREFSDPKGTMDINLQHNSVDEGIEYFKKRNEAYVTRYTPGLTGLYDITETHATVTPGMISLRGSVFNSYMNTRLNVASIREKEYFSKSVIRELVNEHTPVNIPDAISPNGDGYNDKYVVEKRQPTDKVRFEVFTRNQVLVYQHLDYDDSFDGTGNLGGFMGSVLPDGIYYYLISVNGAKGIPGYLIINR